MKGAATFVIQATPLICVMVSSVVVGFWHMAVADRAMPPTARQRGNQPTLAGQISESSSEPPPPVSQPESLPPLLSVHDD
jgi:hypothetical protein